MLAYVLGDESNARLRDFLSHEKVLNWQEFLRLTHFHALGAHVWFAIKKAQVENLIPNHVRDALRERYLVNLAIDRVQSEELKALLNQFRKTSVSAIVLKGLPLHQRLFTEHEWPRGAGDIDFLIHQSDVKRSEEVLRNFGYHFSPEDDRTRDWYLRWRNQIPYEKTEGVKCPVTVEIHWSATRDLFGPHQSFERLLGVWGEAQDMCWQGISVRVLSNEHLIFYQAFHLFSQWGKLALPTLIDFGRAAKILWPQVSKEQFCFQGASFALGRLVGAAAKAGRLFYELPEFRDLERVFPLESLTRYFLTKMLDLERMILTGHFDWKWTFLSFYPLDLIFGLAPHGSWNYWQFRLKHSRWFER